LFKKFKAIETLATWVSFWWGFVLLMPHDTFSVSPTYKPMNDLAPEWVWGVWMLSVSLLHLYGILKCNNKVKRLALLLSTSQWFFVSTMLAIADFQNNVLTTGFGAYAGLGFICSWLYSKITNGGDEKWK
jgi:hypothetical protein